MDIRVLQFVDFKIMQHPFYVKEREVKRGKSRDDSHTIK